MEKSVREQQRITWCEHILFGICCVFFLAIYVSLLFNRNVWTDEAYTIQLIRENSFLEIIAKTAMDVHPPLYYLLLKIFVTIFGQSITVYKLFSVIPMVLLMVLAWTKVRRNWGIRVACFFLLVTNAIPCMLEYTIQIRMYSLASFFTTWAALSAYYVWKTGKPLQVMELTVAAMGACYTHNYAMLNCVFVYVILLGAAVVRYRKKKEKHLFIMALLSGCVVAVSFLPWLGVLLRQTTQRVGNYWIEPVTLRVILQYFEDLFGTAIPHTTFMYVCLFLSGIILAVKETMNKKENGIEALLFLCIPVLTASVGIIVSILVTPFFIARYLIPCIGLLALFLAIIFSTQKVYIQVLLAAFGMGTFLSAYYVNFEKEYRSGSLEETLSFMEQNMTEDDYIVYNYELYGFIYKIYFDEDRTIFLSDMDFSSDFENIWYFDSCVTPWLDSSLLESQGLKKEYIANLGIEQNDFVLYKISHE